VDGAKNAPGGTDGADARSCWTSRWPARSPRRPTLVVYFAPNTDAGFVDAVAQAAHATPTPAAISISWGASEDSWTAQARGALDDAMADAVALGVTVTAAAGDDGSADQVQDGRAHVDFPAASPHALACGGTRLVADAATARSPRRRCGTTGPAAGRPAVG